METTLAPSSEWTAAPLRPVARWVHELDDDGRTRLVMRWQVPDLDEALRAPLRATA
jgi:hypothetical protein